MKIILIAAINRILALFFLIIATSPLIAQNQFQNTYEGQGESDARDVIQTKDGGIVFTGRTSWDSKKETAVFLAKTNKAGKMTWSQTYGGNASEAGYAVLEASDGGYVVLGRTKSYGKGSTDIYLVRTDSRGGLIWTWTYGGKNKDYGYEISETKDGGYIICGKTNSSGNGLYDVLLIKVGADGKQLWRNTFGGKHNDYGYSVLQIEDGGYMIAGRTKSLTVNGIDTILKKPNVYLIRTNEKGEEVWAKSYGGVRSEAAYGMTKTKDGNFLLVGRIFHPKNENHDLYVLKVSPDGKIIDRNIYGHEKDEYASSVMALPDGGYVISGFTNSIGHGKSDALLVKIGEDLQVIWSKTFGGKEKDLAQKVICTSDGGLILAGSTNSITKGKSRAYLVKTNALGESVDFPGK